MKVVSISGDSHMWKGIIDGMDVVCRGTRVRVRNGHDNSFWTDHWWCVCGSIGELVSYIDVRDLHLRVAHVISSDKTWDLSTIYTSISPIIRDCILSVPLVQRENVQDSLIWQWSSNVESTMRFAYAWLCVRVYEDSVSWKWIWKLKLP